MTSAATVQLGRLETRGLLLGLSTAQVAVLGGALVIAVTAEYAAGAAGLAATAPAWILLSVAALVPVAGRPVLDWLPILAGWQRRRVSGRTRHLTRVREVSATQLRLPGIAGQLNVLTGPSSGAALIHDRRTSTVTALLSISGTGFVLADEATQGARVAGWGRLLAGLCQQRAVVRLQVLDRSLPGGASQVRRWWAEHALADAPWAAQVVAELVADAQEVSQRHECFIAVAIRSPRTGRQGPNAASLTVVEQQLKAVADAARTAELEVHGWASQSELASVLRRTYDPAGAARAGDLAGGELLVGPMGQQEQWDSLRTDSAWHAVYWIEQWPRAQVHASFLQPLLLGRGASRSLSIITEPLSAAKALKDIRRAKVEHIADAAQRGRLGQLEDEAVRAEADDLLRREHDLVAGHGDLRFVGLLTVSAPSEDALAAACAATESAAAQAMCEIRLLVGQQAAAFAAAALPFARSVT